MPALSLPHTYHEIPCSPSQSPLLILEADPSSSGWCFFLPPIRSPGGTLWSLPRPHLLGPRYQASGSVLIEPLARYVSLWGYMVQVNLVVPMALLKSLCLVGIRCSQWMLHIPSMELVTLVLENLVRYEKPWWARDVVLV